MMRSLCLFAIFILFPFQADLCVSAGNPQISVEIMGVGNSPKAESTKKMNAFGGQTARLYLEAFGLTDKSIEIAMDLFQAGSGKIAVPLTSTPPAPIDPDKSQNRRRISLPLELPAVEQTCTFYARCRFRIAGENVWQNGGSAEIRVYPSDILKPMRLFAENKPVLLFGESEKLRTFFREVGIRFEHSDDPFHEDQKEPSLAFMDNLDKEALKFAQYLPSNLAMLALYPAAGGFSRTIIRRAGNGILIDAKMDWPADLTKDPAAQEFLLELFSLALEQLQANPN